MADPTPVGDLDQQLLGPQSQQLHTNGVNSSASLPRYTGSDFLSGPRSLSDSSTAESPVGNDDLQTNGQTTFHHHHIHHHNPATTYASHYPVLPSLFYSPLYHSSSGTDLLPSSQLTARGDDLGGNTNQRTHTGDHSAVWRPY